MYKKTVLENGIRIVTEEIPHVRSVTIGFWVRSGSRDEDPSNNGISHLIEHLLFKGTTTRSAREIAEQIDAAGGQLNAFTSKEHTCYYARVLDGHLAMATEILADMLLNSTILEAELEKEKGVILEEIKMYEDSPDELVHDLFAEALLSPHPLGQSVLGKAENIERLDRDTILQYMDRHYTPQNLVVSVAGNVTHEEVVGQIRRHFGSFHRAGYRPDEVLASPKRTNLIRPKDTEQIHLCVGGYGVKRHDPDRFALYVLDTALGGGMSSRLFQELREEHGLVYSTYSYHSCFHEAGIFAIYAGTSPKHASTVLDLIRSECTNVGQEGIRGEELRRAKEQIKGNLMLSLESTANRMSRIAKAELFSEDLLSPDDLIERIDAVTHEDTIRIASRIMHNDGLSLTAIGPTPESWSGTGRV